VGQAYLQLLSLGKLCLLACGLLSGLLQHVQWWQQVGVLMLSLWQ
jgi:hypothetical protein